MIKERTSGDDDASEVPMVTEKQVDNDGDAIMDINLDKHFKAFNFDKVDYFNQSEVNEVKQALKAKKFGATIYHETVIVDVIASSKSSSDRKLAAMTRARKLAQLDEKLQFTVLMFLVPSTGFP